VTTVIAGICGLAVEVYVVTFGVSSIGVVLSTPRYATHARVELRAAADVTVRDVGGVPVTTRYQP